MLNKSEAAKACNEECAKYQDAERPPEGEDYNTIIDLIRGA